MLEIKLLTDELTYLWGLNKIESIRQSNEISKIQSFLENETRIDLDEFKHWERNEILKSDIFISSEAETLMNQTFEVNPFFSFYDSGIAHPEFNSINRLVLVPKFIAYNELTYYPIYMINEMVYLNQLLALNKPFSINDLIEISINKNANFDIHFIKNRIINLLKRFSSYHYIKTIH